MKKMKKVLAVALSLVMAGSLAACGSSSTETKASETAAESTAESGSEAASEVSTDGKVYNIGICQLIQHDALDAATCATIINSFVSNNDDLILANATAALQAAAAGTNTIPILGTAVTDYGVALDIDNFDGTVGGNISGTADLAPLDGQADMLHELFPDAKKVGLLYCSAEANSQFQVDTIKEYLEKLGYTCEYYAFSDSNDLSSVCTSAANDSDVIYVPTDNTVANNTEIVNNICTPAGVPVIAGEEGICKGCGVATLSISYYDLGVATGKMAVKVLQGEDISTMPVEYAPTFTKEYVASRCEAYGITVPDDYVALEE